MPLHQALRMFIYRRMIDRGNPSGLILMQMEVLKFIADADEGTLGFQIKRFQVIDNIVEKLLSKSATELKEEWEKAGIPNITEKMFEVASQALGFMLVAAGKGLWWLIKQKFEATLAMLVEHTVPITATALVSAETYRWYANWATNT